MRRTIRIERMPVNGMFLDCLVTLGDPCADVRGPGLVLDLGNAWLPVVSVVVEGTGEELGDLDADARRAIIAELDRQGGAA